MGSSHSKSLIINNNQLKLPNTIVKQILGLLNDLKVGLVCKYWFIYLIPESFDRLSCEFNFFEGIIRRYQNQVKILYNNHIRSLPRRRLNDSDHIKVVSDSNLILSISNLNFKFESKFNYNFEKSILNQSNFSGYLSNVRILTLSNMKFNQINEFFKVFKETSKLGDRNRLVGLHLIDMYLNGLVSDEIFDWIRNQCNLEEFSYLASRGSRVNLVPLPSISPLKLTSLSICYVEHPNALENTFIGLDRNRNEITGKLPFYENLKRFKLKVEYVNPTPILDDLQCHSYNLTHLTLSGVLSLELKSFPQSLIMQIIPNLINLQYLKITKGNHETSYDNSDYLIDRIQQLPNLKTLKISIFPMSNQQIVQLVNFPSSKITKYSFRYVSLTYDTLLNEMLPSYTALHQYYNITSLSLDYTHSLIEPITNLIKISTTIKRIKLFYVNNYEVSEIIEDFNFYQLYTNLIQSINSSKSLIKFEIPINFEDQSLELTMKKIPFNNPNVTFKESIDIKRRYLFVEKIINRVAM